ncbi:MAG TPA: LysE family translocator [Burkholderiaceae bacterium]|nr:LysE family translocator [Burkholderiaceae bacterium]
MDPSALAVFAAALFVAAASPGPGIAAIVARVLGRGARGAVPFAAGVAAGDLVWLGAAVGGLSVLAQTFHGVFVAIKWAGVAYLAWLAWRMWRAPAPVRELRADARPERPSALFAAGLAVTLGNPKVMVFYVALLPTLVDVARVDLLGWAWLSAITLAVLAAVFGAWIGLAARARALFGSPRALRRMQRGAAGTMAGAAAWVATR